MGFILPTREALREEGARMFDGGTEGVAAGLSYRGSPHISRVKRPWNFRVDKKSSNINGKTASFK